MAIDPRGADLKRFLHEDPGGPVVMLNLLRFAEGGRESCDQYAKALSETFLPPKAARSSTPETAARRSSLSRARTGTPSSSSAIPPARRSARMVADPEYQQVTHLRT